MENFIQGKFENYNSGRAPQKTLHSPLEVKAQLCKFFETEGCTLNDVLLTVYTTQI